MKELNNILKAAAVCGQAHIPILLVGDPGVGKTVMIEALAKTQGKKFIDVRLSCLAAEDLTGLPVYNNQTDTVAYKLAKMFDPKTFEGNAILFFDEITSAGAETLKGCLRILNERKFPNHEESIPDDVWIIAACNPPSSGVDCQELPPAIANRFCWIPWDLDDNEWLDWMRGNGTSEYRKLEDKELTYKPDGKTIAQFLDTNRSYIHKMNVTSTAKGGTDILDFIAESVFPSNRTWHWFSKVINSPYAALLGFGLLGEETYLKFVTNKELDITGYLDDPKTFKVNEMDPTEVQIALLKASTQEDRFEDALKLFIYIANTYGAMHTAARTLKLINTAKRVGKLKLLTRDVLAMLSPRSKEVV